MQSVTVRKARQQEHEAAAYNAPVLQKQKENTGTQLTCSFLMQSKTPVHEMELFTVMTGNITISIYLI